MNKIKPVLLCLGLLLLVGPVLSQRQQDRYGIRVDAKPFRAFSSQAASKIRRGAVRLERPFRLEYDVTLRRDGLMDMKTSRVVKRSGDRRMADLAKQGIDAIGKSGYFGYFTSLDPNVKKLSLVVSQDADNFDAVIKTKFSSAARASVMASSLNMMFAASRLQSKMADNTKFVIEHITFATQGSDLHMRFGSPAGALHEVIRKEVRKTV